MVLDPERLTGAVSAMAGGAFFGLVNLSALVLNGQPVRSQDVIRAGFNMACAMIGGFLVAYFMLPNIAGIIPLAGLKDAHGLGFVIGAFGWVLAPLAYKAVLKWGEKQAREAGR